MMEANPEGVPMKLWIDDCRIPVTDEYVWAQTSQTAKQVLRELKLGKHSQQLNGQSFEDPEIVVFDNDLGPNSYEDGNKILRYMLEEVAIYPKSIVIITANPVERVNMQEKVEATCKYGRPIHIEVQPHYEDRDKLQELYDPHYKFYMGKWPAVMYERV
jgi:hypothetical protein